MCIIYSIVYNMYIYYLCVYNIIYEHFLLCIIYICKYNKMTKSQLNFLLIDNYVASPNPILVGTFHSGVSV